MEESTKIVSKVAELNTNLKHLAGIQNLWLQHNRDCKAFCSKFSDIIKAGEKPNATSGGQQRD